MGIVVEKQDTLSIGQTHLRPGTSSRGLGLVLVLILAAVMVLPVSPALASATSGSLLQSGITSHAEQPSVAAALTHPSAMPTSSGSHVASHVSSSNVAGFHFASAAHPLPTLPVSVLPNPVLQAPQEVSPAPAAIPTGSGEVTHTAGSQQSIVSVSVSPQAGIGNIPQVSPQPHSNAIGLGHAWEGLDYGQGTSGGWYPPDGAIAVGPNYVVQGVNLELAVWTTSGTFVTENSYQSMFGGIGVPSTDHLSDPQMLYSASDQRYFISILDVTKGEFFVGVSAGNFSNGGWVLSCDNIHWYCNYPINGGIPTGDFPDMPKLGISANVVTVSASICVISTDSCSAGGMIWSIAKAGMLTDSGTSWQWWGPFTTWGLYLNPVNSLSSTTTQYVIGQTSTNLQVVSITGTPPSAVESLATPAVGTFVSPVNAPQAGSASLVCVACIADPTRAMDAVYENGMAWAVFDVGCNNPVQDCVRFIEYNTNTATVVQDGTFFSGALYDYYPVLTLDPSGDMAVEFAASNATVYPSLAVAGESYDVTGTISGSSYLVQGLSSETTGRFGDYFEAAQDPLNPYSLWVEGEYDGNNVWNTWIANVGISPAGPLPMSFTATPTTVDVGQLVSFDLSSSSTQCGSGQADWCTWYVSGYTPTPDSCKQQGPIYAWQYYWTSPQTVYIGNTTYIDEYNSGTCSLSNYVGGTLQSPGLTITVDPALVVPAPNVTRNPADIGQSITFTASPSGGSGSYTTYAWSGLPTGCLPVNSPSITCLSNSTTGSPYTVTVAVTDSNTNTVTSSALSVTVDPALVVPAPGATLKVLDANQQSTTLTAAPTGGSTVYTTYVWTGLPTGCSSANNANILCSPTTAGNYSVTATVTDSNGNSVVSPVTTILVDPTLTIGGITGPSSGSIGTPVTFTTSGGAGGSGAGTYSYAWSGLPTGCATANSATLTCTPAGPNGLSNISVSVTDLNGETQASPAHPFLVGNALAVPVPTASKPSVDVNQMVVFTAAPTGGSGTYTTYLWQGLPTGCATANQAKLNCTPTSAAGSPYSVNVTVTDSLGNVYTSPALSYTVYADPSVTVPTPSTSSGKVGQAVTFSTTGSGGSGGLTYAWTPSGVGLGCVTSTSTTVTCTPTSAGNYTLQVILTDSNGMSVNATSANFAVSGGSASGPTISAFTANPATLALGAWTNLTVTASGGTGTLTYNYSGLPGGCASADLSKLACHPSQTGTFTVKVTVTDQAGMTGTKSVSLTVNAAGTNPLAIASFLANPSSVTLGSSTTLTVSTTGGSGTLSYAYTGLPAGCSSADVAALTCKPTAAGTFHVTVYVNDTGGEHVTAQTTLTATTGSGSSSTQSSDLMLVLLLVALAAVVVIVVVVLASRRKKGHSGAPAPYAPPPAAPGTPPNTAPPPPPQ